MTQAALPDFDVELEQVKRARANIDLLRKNRMAQPKGEMVGKTYVAPHWSEHLAPLIEQGFNIYGEKKLGEREVALSKAMKAGREQWLGEMPKTTPGHEVQGPPEEGQGPPMSKPIEPTQQDKLAWAARGESNPLTKALAAQYGADVLIKEPEREEARAFRASESDKAQALAREKMTEQIKVDRERLAEQIRHSKEQERHEGLSLDEKKEWHAATVAMEKKLNEMKMSVEPKPRADERQKLETEVNATYSVENTAKEVMALLPHATGSGAGNVIDTVGKWVGIPIYGAKEAADLKVLESKLMQHQPKFKGTDSDRDTKLYQQAAADIGNANTPVDIRMKAIKTVRRLAREDMAKSRRLAENFNAGSGEHLPRIDIPGILAPLTEEEGGLPVAPGAAPQVPGVPPKSVLPKSRAASGVVGGMEPPPQQMAPPGAMPPGIPPGAMPPGIPPGANVPTNVSQGPPVTAQLPPAEMERAGILMSEYRKPLQPVPGEDPAVQAARHATDKESLRKELARIGVDAETGGPLQRRATDKAPAKKVRTWNQAKGAFDE